MNLLRCLSLLPLGFSFACAAAETGQTLVAADLKSEPYMDAKTLAALPANSPLEILKRQGGWMQVKSAGSADGWLKMTAIKLGGGASGKGSSGLGELWNVAQGGRSGNTGVTVATGVRGLGAEDLKNASANPEAVKKMQGYAVSRADAESYSTQAKLQRQSVGYLAKDAEGGNAK